MAKYDIFAALETHPIPMEFNNKLTTAEWLSYLQGIISEVANSNEDFQDKTKEDIQKSINDAITKINIYLNSNEFNDKNKTQIEKYVNENLNKMIGNVMKGVEFGLTDDGRFMATIPTTWNFISFDTNIDTESSDYGKLILTY